MILAAMDLADPAHGPCRDLLEHHRGPLLVPVLCIAEVGHLAGRRLGPRSEVRFLGDLASSAYTPVAPSAFDWERIGELVARYHDLPLGTVDASVVVAAEVLEIGTVATLDRRHFSVVRPRHVERFTLVPA